MGWCLWTVVLDQTTGSPSSFKSWFEMLTCMYDIVGKEDDLRIGSVYTSTTTMVAPNYPKPRRRLVGQALLYSISVFASLGVFLVRYRV
jgi:hypothetical protein